MPIPANSDARVTSVKAAAPLPDPEFEEVEREVRKLIATIRRSSFCRLPLSYYR